jgi:hypothetical protein
MPKLLVFAPCEKVIISQDENNPTLIAILSSLTLEGEEAAITEALKATESDKPALVPIRWSVFALWAKEPADGTREFTQTIDLESPARNIILTNRGTFAFAEGIDTHRLLLNLPGFPIRERGVYILRLSLDGAAIAEYPIELKLTKPEPTTAH